MTSSSTPTNIQALLANLRDAPVSTASDSTLSTVLEYLMGIAPTPPTGTFHWFCRHASSITIDAATFLIRLFAYQSEPVNPWKARMHLCLSRCTACVQGFERVKVSSSDTFFGAFDKAILRDFYESFEQWELEGVLEDLTNAKLLDQPALSSRTLSDAPPAVVYRMMSTWTIFKDPRIQSLITARTPAEPIHGWPTDIIPPGIFVLLMHNNPKVRTWAVVQASKCDTVPVPIDQFVGGYVKAIESIGRSLNPTEAALVEDSTFVFASDRGDLWHGLYHVLRYTPVESIKSNSQQNIDLRRIIIGHAHDTGPHFFNVIRCLSLVVKRLDRGVWDGEGPEFPQVVFDSIKDNSALSKIILEIGSSEADVTPWILGLFKDYIRSTRDRPVFGEILAKMADFLCEETQHERFKDVRPVTMSWAVRLLHNVLRQEHASNRIASNFFALNKVLDIHGDIFVTVAFSRQHEGEKWCTARTRARILVTQIFENDATAVKGIVLTVCKILAHATKSHHGIPTTPTLSISQGMWAKFYSTLQTHDIDGVAILIGLAAKTAYLDQIDPKPFKRAFEIVPETEGLLKEVNRSLGKMRAGLVAAITEFENHNLSTSALDLLQRPNVAKHIMLLMLSPVEDLQVAAQILVRVAYDVDARQECFRALLENVPDAAFEGIFEFLAAHAGYADQWPEACSLSKSLVSCFTDIIEVLCTTPNGLLHSPQFLQSSEDNGPASMLPKLWSLMAKSITIIFKRTPTWSLYFESKMLVDWMRDALIYGRDMLEKWRVIETAANTRPSDEQVKPGDLSLLGKKMMETFQDVLLELTKWLRLTDEELLHQAFGLLTSLLDCFRKANITPKEENVKKLRRHIDNARAGGPGALRTRLDAGRLLMLEVALDDLEISEIPPPLPPPKKPSPPPSPSLPPKVVTKPVESVKKNYIQGGSTKTASAVSSSGTNRFSVSKPKVTSAASSKPTKSISKFFTDKDKELLDAEVAIPSFRKSTKAPTTAASTTTKPIARARDTVADDGRSEKSIVSVPDSSSDSSDEEDADEEEKPQKTLAGLNKLQRSPKISKAPERRQTKLLEIPNQTSRADIERLERIRRRDEARIAAARLKPDISGLHKILLSWDYNHTGSTPPGERLKLNQVPPRFNNFTDYENFLKPLLLLECWAQITNAKETTPDIVDCKVTSRQFMDSWLDIDISVEGNIRKDWYLGETDLVLLSNAISGKRIMAKTQSYRNSPHQGTQATLRCIVKDGDPGLQMNTKWQLNKLVNLATLHREFAALVSVQYYDFADIILQPRLSTAAKPERRDIEQTMSIYNLNEPQAIAILCSLRTDGFTLIQGPPGTGKTSTICGLVAASLSKRARAPVAVHVGRNTTPMEKRPTPKILVCAPSNAAIDEIASRLSTGLQTSEKGPSSVKVVRIGAPGGISSSVLDIFLETLVEQKLDPKQAESNDAGPAQIQALKRDVESLKQLISDKHQEKAAITDNNVRTHALAEEISQLNARRTQLAQQLNHLRDKQRADTRGLDALRRKTRMEVLREADVICSTLSGSANEQLEQIDIEMVIIDEAAQAIELSSLIPLKYRFNRCIMVGDPKQLPPTVLSKDACKYNYNESLFVRLQKQRPDAVHLLSIQYRMHPEISRLPSSIFYHGKLLDGPSLDVKTKQPWQTHGKFGTYRFFNVTRGLEESTQGHSLKNRAECEVAVALYARLRLEFSSINWDYRVGVISMYSAQLFEIRRQFQQRFGKEVVETVDFKTVDGFQGQEKDVIILSCVRAGPGVQSVGFLADDRRMNVALTRAKSSLFILGNAPTLERSDPTWRAIVSDARSRSSLVDTDPTYFTRPVTTPVRSTQSTKVTKVVPPVPIPTDLVAPRDFKIVKQMKDTPLTSDSTRSSTTGPRLTPPQPTPVADGPRANGQPPRPHPQQPQPQARASNDIQQRKPSVKRPKETTLFIPKPKKRPPDDNASGPSNRRKIA